MSVEAIDSALIGTVLAVQANYYWVKLDASSAGEAKTLLCTRRTRLKKIGQQVMVGDRVQVEEPDWADQRAAIARVFSRQTELDRPPIANANQILLVFALAEPSIEPIQLSRFLVKAESTELTVGVCLSKRDLVAAEVQEGWCDRLRGWGYEAVLISSRIENGLEPLRERLKRNTTVISGPSGVGKSSLINQLVPTVDQRVSAVSGKLGRGRHTTRHVELFELPDSGLLADTPGFNQPDLDCQPIELAYLFPEARSRLETGRCQFSDCLHRDEPNCVVRGDWERYAHYLSFLEEAIDRQTMLDRQGEAESTLKRKSNESGRAQFEPKLEAKKYRRPSRRTEKQTLETLYQDLDTAKRDDEE